MDLRDLECFLAVAREGHVGRAAAALHITQPPLSRQIKALETELGTSLFLRTPKGVELTEAGRTLLEDASNVLAMAERAKERTTRAGRGLVGRLDVGLFGSGVLDVIPRLLARFHKDRPEVKIVLNNLTKTEQLAALREHRITIGFNRFVPDEDDIAVETVLREPLTVCVKTNHRLARQKSVTLRDLDREPLVLYPNQPVRGLAQEVADAFRAEGLVLNVEQEVEDVFTAVALVASSFGACVTTRSAASLRLPGVVFRPLVCAELPDVELSCLYLRDNRSPILGAFLDIVRDRAEA